MSVSYEGLDLDVTVLFDSANGGELDKRTLRFSGVSAFVAAIFPGVDSLDLSGNLSHDPPGALIEYIESEAADRWSDYLREPQKTRHFQVCFLSENKRIDVFAVRFELLE